MVDLVIPLGWGSCWDNFEIKYSLRSLERHLSGIGKVFIVTDLSGLPKFLTNVIHLPCPDDTNCAAINTYKKILKAAKDKRVSDTFLLSNDDFFLNKDYDAATFPYYHHGEIMAGFENLKKKGNPYPVSRKITDQVLRSKGFTTFHFGVHCPFLIDKEKFVSLEKMFRWERSRGYLTRCIYGNVFGIQATYTRDFKLNKKLPAWQIKNQVDEHDFYSVGEKATGPELYKFMENRYPEPSKCEQ